MIKLNIPMPTSCDSCPFKGARLCYIATWLGTEYREVPEEGRAEWCPMEDVSKYEDDGKQSTMGQRNGGMPIKETAAMMEG